MQNSDASRRENAVVCFAGCLKFESESQTNGGLDGADSHARPCAGHPRSCCNQARKTWMAGTSPAMTKISRNLPHHLQHHFHRHQHRIVAARQAAFGDTAEIVDKGDVQRCLQHAVLG
jgi:hypothetical protein